MGETCLYLASDLDFLPVNRFWRIWISMVIPALIAVVLGTHFDWIKPLDPVSIIQVGSGAGALFMTAFLMRPNLAYLLKNNDYKLRTVNYLFNQSLILFAFSVFLFLLNENQAVPWLDVISYVSLVFIATCIGTIAAIELSLLPSQKRRPVRIAIAAITDSSLAFAHDLKGQRFVNVEFVGFFEDRLPDRLPDYQPFEVLGRFEVISTYVSEKKLSHVFVSLPTQASYRFGFVLEQLLDTTCSVHYLHDFLLFKPIREAMTAVGNNSVFTVIDTPSGGLDHWIKRSIDAVGAAVALVVLSPLFVVVAIWIKWDSPGAVFFRQNRWGTDAQPFGIYKFRSMTQETSQNASGGEAIVQTTANDMRVTKVGAFIRRTSIDELPQLVNILLGSMSFVGPRPHATGHNKEYRGLIKGYMLRHKVKPGLTGWAQIHGLRGETDTLDKMAKRIDFDLEYLRNWTPLLDVYIVIKTVHVVVLGKNAH
jgi:putative colanic acid biosysnthesis UDP-glucose lipid carrier transferase